MDEFTQKHLALWCANYAVDDAEAESLYHRIAEFVDEHLDGVPGDRSWPEVLRLVERLEDLRA